MTPLVLTIDIGTQSIRALLAKKDGSFHDICQKKYEVPYYSKQPFYAEQEPDFYFDALCEVSKQLCERNRDVLKDVICVTVTVIRDTVMCLDKNNKPLRDIILWLDKREAEFDDPFPPAKKAMFKMVGMTDTTEVQYKSSVCNWLMQNEPEMWEKTAKYVFLPAYLNYKLTGRLVDSIGNMIGHVPFDYKKRTWQAPGGLTRCITDVPPEKLCDLIEPGETVGKITSEASVRTGIPEGLPLIATGSDKGCETLGLSVIHEHQAALSFGTTATIQVATKKYFEPQQFMPAYPAIIKDMFNPEIQIYRGYWMLSWFVKEFGEAERIQAEKLGCPAEAVFDSHLRDVPPGCDGLVLQPYWTPGITIPNARGAVIGFTDVHTKYHLYRAVIEGINFALMDAMYTIERRSGVSIDSIYISGGGSRSEPILQITADMFGLPVRRIQTHEACALGSSMAGFVAMGEFSDYDTAIASMVHERDVFLPDEKNHAIYKELFDGVYSKMYKRLEGIYKSEKQIYKRRNKL